MSVLQSEVFEAFRAIDIPEDKALCAAEGLGKRDDDITSIRRRSVLDVGIAFQSQLSFYDDKVFYREADQTKVANAVHTVALANRFS